MSAISVTVLEGSRSVINSRILRVQESSLLKDVLRLVTSDDDVRRLTSVQTASDPGTRYDAVPEDDVGLHLVFGRRHVFFTLATAAASNTCQQTPARSVNVFAIRFISIHLRTKRGTKITKYMPAKNFRK